MTAGTSALLLTIAGGVAGIAALTKDRPDGDRIVTAIGQAAGAVPPAAPPARADLPAPRRAEPKPQYDPAATLPRLSDEADRTGTRPPRRTAGNVPPAAAPPAAAPRKPAARTTKPDAAPTSSTARPALTTRTEVEKREIPFGTRLVRDPLLRRGEKEVRAAGEPGEETLRYLVTYTDGRETDRKLLAITTTREPQDRVVALGSRRGLGHGGSRHRRCEALKLCVPLGRSAPCPDNIDGAGKTESTLLGGSVTVLDQDIELLDAQTAGKLPCTPQSTGR